MEKYLYIWFALMLVFVLAGYAFKGGIEKKIESIIQKTLTDLNLSLVKITTVSCPDTGPFEHKYRGTQVNVMASIMGLHPDYTAFRKLIVINEEGLEKEYWIKIEFDIAEFKGVEIKEVPS